MLRGYALTSRRSAASSQELALKEAGVGEVYVEGRDLETFEAALNSLRPKTGLHVVTLADLAANRKQLRKRMQAVHDKGCHIVETSTGRTSLKKRDLEAMIFDATETLIHAGKGHDPEKAREFGSRGGRPRKPRGISDEEAEKHWHSLKHETNTEALKHMPGWDAASAWRAFGASGRKTGPRRKIAKRKKRT